MEKSHIREIVETAEKKEEPLYINYKLFWPMCINCDINMNEICTFSEFEAGYTNFLGRILYNLR